MNPATLSHIQTDLAWADEVILNAKVLVAELLASELTDAEFVRAQWLQLAVRDALLALGRCGERLGELRAEGGKANER